MKGQQLLYGFLPGVTAAVLTTQPSVAEGLKVNSVQQASSPSVLTANDSQTLVADNVQTQLPKNTAQVFPDVAENVDLSENNSEPLISQTNPVLLTGNAGVDQEQKLHKDEIKVVSSSPNRELIQKLKHKRITNNQKQSNLASNQPELVNTVVPVTSSFPNLAPAKNLKTQLPIALQPSVKGAGAASLLVANSCSLAKGDTALILATNCPQSYSSRKQIAQNSDPVPETTTPPSTVESAPETTTPPATVDSAPATTPVSPTNVPQVPETLTPKANPLLIPTKTEEVLTQETQAITLTQALEIARRNNRDLQVSLLELERSQAALRESQAALFPNLTVNADITRSQSASSQLSVERAGGGTDEPSTDFTSQAQLSYDIYTSGRRNAAIKEAEEQVRFNELAVESQAEEIRRNVAREYYDLQQADEQVRIAQSAVENSQASLKDAEALERAGVGTRFDVLRSQVNLANAQQELTSAISRQQIARRTLATRLSLPQSVNITAADPVQLAGLWQQSLENSIILAYQNRPELQQQLAQRNISEQQRRQALANLGPQVSLIANYNLLDQFDDDISVTDGYSFGIRASLNLFDGGASRARATQARKNIAIAETQFAEQRNQIRFQVEQAYFTQQANLNNVQTANTALEQARESLRLARLRFQAGVGTQTDVINAENELTRAEGNRVTAILDYNRALVDLQRAVTSRALTNTSNTSQ